MFQNLNNINLLFFLVLFIILNISIINAQNSSNSTRIEFAFQVQSGDPAYSGSVKFEVSHVTNERMFCTNGGCNYSLCSGEFSTKYIIINGQYLGTNKGIFAESDCGTPLSNNNDEIATRLSQYKISVYYWNNGWQLITYVYYDNRDCGFLGGGNCSMCENKGDNDLTLRYNVSSQKLYLYNGHSTNSTDLMKDPNWKEVGIAGYTYINWWDVKDYNTPNLRCPLDVPSTPENVIVYGINGENPTIVWDFNPESDIVNYNIYRSGGGGQYHQIASVSNTINTYTDVDVTISGGKFSPQICYAVTAVDITNLESEFSQSDCAHSNTFMEKKATSNNTERVDSLFLAYPNPFNSGTVIKYSLLNTSEVELAIFNSLGERIGTLMKTIQNE